MLFDIPDGVAAKRGDIESGLVGGGGGSGGGGGGEGDIIIDEEDFANANDENEEEALFSKRQMMKQAVDRDFSNFVTNTMIRGILDRMNGR